MTHFKPHTDFDRQSLQPTCPITNKPKGTKRPNTPGSEAEVFILRGPEIMYHDGRGERSLGFFDVRTEAVAQAATDCLGMVTAEAHARAREFHMELADRNSAQRKEIESLRAQTEAAVLGNAELIVQNADLRTELEAAYAELYPELEALASEDMLDQDDIESLDQLAEAELSERPVDYDETEGYEKSIG